MKKYLLSAALCGVLSLSSVSAMIGHDEIISDSDVPRAPATRVVPTFHVNNERNVSNTCKVCTDLHRDAERLCFNFTGRVGNTDTTDTLFAALQGFRSLNALKIQVERASSRVVLGLSMQIGLLGINADFPEAQIRELMRLGLSDEMWAQVADMSREDATFSPTFNLETPTPFVWEPSDDPAKQKLPLIYISVLQGIPEDEARESADLLFGHPEWVRKAMEEEGYDPETGERRR